MQSSGSSSSPKRAASEDPTMESSTLPPSHLVEVEDEELDAYMAEQGESDAVSSLLFGPPLPATLDGPTSHDHHTMLNGNSGVSTQDKPMTPSQRLDFVEAAKTPMSAGQTWFVISRSWYRRWYRACTGEQDKEGTVDEKDIGPVDNTELVDKKGRLTTSVIEGVNAEFVPQATWDAFVAWYGPPKFPLPRQVILRGYHKEPYLELHPLHLRVLLIIEGHLDSEQVYADSEPTYITISESATVIALRQELAKSVATGHRISHPFRTWRWVDGSPAGDEDDGSIMTVDEFDSHQMQLLEPSEITAAEALVQSGDVFLVEFREEGEWLIDENNHGPQSTRATAAAKANSNPIMNALSGGQSSNLPQPIFGQNGDFFSSFGQLGRPFTIPASSGSNEITQLPRLVASTSYKSSQEPGTLGLGNMGNTCFMNSALQCLAHTKELTEYFLTGVYQDELNPDNPLGMQGAIAESFGALLQRIWAANPQSSSYSPREFKQQLTRFAPQFSGYQQHDSQELVAFLLDGLHEDLNRIKKKPYVEKPDWEGGAEKELTELARASWDGYLQRNDSVIVDLFQGQYKSTLICPECAKVSITFDPFMYLTLPLPVQKKWRHEILYVPWDIEKKHVKVPIEIGRDASFKDLRQLLGRWMGAPGENLLTLEVFNHRFYKNLDDHCLVADAVGNDTIVCFELPCPAHQSRTYKRQETDPFILPVFLCDSGRTNYGRTTPSLFGYPCVAVITHEEAKSLDAMYAAVVDRLARWTRNARDLYTWEAGPADDMEEVSIPIGGFSPVSSSVTEIKENGEVVTVEETPEEGDIGDERAVMNQDDTAMADVEEGIPKIVGPKHGIFNLRVHGQHKDFGAGTYSATTPRFESWESRGNDEDGFASVLLRPDDSLFCEFDENMKAYYFEDARRTQPLWDLWEEFIHPEYIGAQKAAEEKKQKGISLQDCLAEFTKEEQLGEDDLWYCPRCKKHQQATKKFDLWKVPDVLVVHLKRFSNSRVVRDKIDAFVDFPLEGLDLSEMVGERAVARKLLEEGVDIAELGLSAGDEPLVYDLFAVDEHMGGLAGGHYRAYALNHLSEKWYHFDDSYVKTVRPIDAVNPNAYLLFYKRRSAHPLGGTTHTKIESARVKEQATTNPDLPALPVSLPTPPSEPDPFSDKVASGRVQSQLVPESSQGTPHPDTPSQTSSPSSPPPLDDGEPPSFEDAQFDQLLPETVTSLILSDLKKSFDTRRFNSGDYSTADSVSNHASPASSNEAEPDIDEFNHSGGQWDGKFFETFHDFHTDYRPDFRGGSYKNAALHSDHSYIPDHYDDEMDEMRLSGYSSKDSDEERSEANPFDGSHGQNEDEVSDIVQVTEIPIHETTLHDIDL
ncbi:hypothetical protein JAAARDRAFT_123860 [Jaapia argillacea MUCL 33604]|uniref:ubiquitinyl hydrolase 1 n=1 Tax=Jaapia argillacea MUCL 33604 TaxID=933084 RepID=A0A067Q680_9AGAM|nr:hypothetical protein JAAARDRAFT_123860 [Jaapia argillacea MUCL 33604]